ncbi:MAG: hypothetical protein BRD29_00750 [Bacteroidetes bacterium QH_2_67_10]|nr:MAG: hypothetical protein BRD29_00750 [Bacteroidetes bacterium QH_2_67_10]
MFCVRGFAPRTRRGSAFDRVPPVSPPPARPSPRRPPARFSPPPSRRGGCQCGGGKPALLRMSVGSAGCFGPSPFQKPRGTAGPGPV